jgi:D-glycero-alpha-D-manno-heptose-7-phosphate kinase
MDLAGGTLDLWPLYLMIDRPMTVNMGIDLWAETELRVVEGGGAGSITFQSIDQRIEQSLSWDELDQASLPPGLDLHVRLLRWFTRNRREELRKSRVAITTRAKSPAGAGLGGSSALNVSMVGALMQWLEAPVDVTRDGERIVEVARDVETQVIKVPAGLQDYFGAVWGGLQRIRWDVQRHGRANLDSALLGPLSQRILLFYSGQSRNSGINNWKLFKDFVDKDVQVRKRFEAIAEATRALSKALEGPASDVRWNAVGDAIRAEWETRRTLASGISTPDIDRAFEVARAGGATAGKICGAGGGGCFFVFEPTGDMQRLESVARAVCQEVPALQRLPYHPSERGLEVTVEPSA